MKVLIAQINPTIGDLSGNTRKILEGISKARDFAAEIVLFPELCLTGYPAEDLLLLPQFMEETDRKLREIIDAAKGLTVIVGVPKRNPASSEKGLFNSAAVIHDQKLLGFQDKSLLPTYDVFDERRYFEPAHQPRIWEINDKKIGITICEDIWGHSELIRYTDYQCDPVLDLTPFKPDLVLNLSASPYSFGKFSQRLAACSRAAQTLECPFILCNQVGGNDSLIFDGHSLYLDSRGNLLECAKGFEEDFLLIDLAKKRTVCKYFPEPIRDLFDALVLGVRDYFHKSGFTRCCFGLSGGIDSALVACIAVKALGAQNVLALSMPSRFSSEGSRKDAQALARNLGIECREISIEKPFQAYLDLLTPHFAGKASDITEENLQARIRGMILMGISNKLGYIVLSPGNKSELAMGYSTLYGDMCGGLGVISDVTKNQVYALAKWLNREKELIPENIIQKAPSAELKPNQTDQDTLPAYEIVDNVLEAYVEEHLSPEEIAHKFHYSIELVKDLVKRIHRNEYKRRQAPPGLRVTEKAFSAGRRFPIVERWV